MQIRVQGGLREAPRLIRGVHAIVISDDLGNPIGVYKMLPGGSGVFHVGPDNADFQKAMRDMGLNLSTPVVVTLKDPL